MQQIDRPHPAPELLTNRSVPVRMGFTVLSVAYPLTVVGPDAAGGSEQILTLLDRTLVETGNRSLVIAAENSVLQGEHIPSPNPPARLDNSVREWSRKIHRQLIREVLASYPVDLIHMQALDFHLYTPEVRPPLLATLHLPPDWYPSSVFAVPQENYHLNFVSSTQFSAAPPSVNPIHVIPNGIEVDRFSPATTKKNYALALGRICPEKGFHFALEAARLAKTDLLLAGEIFPYPDHLEYFDRQIKPRLDSHRRFLGHVGFEEKRKLLAGARCLLITSTVSETSSLVAMEALSSGTPVVAFPAGALREIVESGQTGFLVRDVNEMAAAITATQNLSPELCRTAARRRFSASVMLRRYLELYQQLVSDCATKAGQHERRNGANWLVSW
jgi:glycosyltransferase involved in cell wall biosynthesis